MQEIRCRTMNEIMIRCAQLLVTDGHVVSPRNLTTIELREVALVLTDPTKCVVTIPERNLSLAYLNAEREWYLSGSLNGKEIAKHSKFWEQLCNPDGTVNSNYGYFVFHQICPNGQTQFEWCKQKIIADPNTRQALINYNQVMHKYEENKDFPCTIGQTFRQHDGVIDSTVYMRSNDLIYGTPYDVPWFVSVLQELCAQAGYAVGTFTLIASSLHVYEKHFTMLKEIAHAHLPINDFTPSKFLDDITTRMNAMVDLRNNIVAQKFPLSDSTLYGDGSIGWDSEIENGHEEFWFYLHTWEREGHICILYMKQDGQYYLRIFDGQKTRIQTLDMSEAAWAIPIEALQAVCSMYSIKIQSQ